MIGMHRMHALDRFAIFFAGPKLVAHLYPPNHQHLAVQFDLAGRLGRQLPVRGIDLTRFQRASKCSGQSGSSRRDDVIQRRSARLVGVRRNLVMFCNLAMNAEGNGRLFRG